MGSADGNQPIRALLGLYILIHDVKLSPATTQKVQDGPLTPNTVEFLWLELSQRQLANRIRFYYRYLVISYSNRMQNKTQKLTVNLERRQHTAHLLT